MKPDVLFVGESPPAGAPPTFRPFDCASGTRLAATLGLVSREVLLAHVPFDNIFAAPGVGLAGGPTWSEEDAREAGEGLLIRAPRTVVALGRKPAAALGCADVAPGMWRRVRIVDVDVVVAPHPSGQSQSLNSDVKKARVRRYLLPEIVAGCHTLRPWHFDLSRSEVLADLGAALSPHAPNLGVAAVLIAVETHWSGKQYEVPLLALTGVCSHEPTPDLRKRAASVPKKRLFDDYPVEVLRATIGRYGALGVL